MKEDNHMQMSAYQQQHGKGKKFHTMKIAEYNWSLKNAKNKMNGSQTVGAHLI